MKFLMNIAPARITLTLLAAVISLGLIDSVRAQSEQVLVPSGSFHSVMPEVKGKAVPVDSFYIDVTAVTNEEFAEFLKQNEEWQQEKTPAVFANKGYLKNWNKHTPDYDEINREGPVTRISWFAANAYCQWTGGRLPTLNEWEYSAQLMEFSSAAEAKEFANRLVSWYSSVDSKNIAPVSSTGIETKHGVKDQFGLIMEWVEDYKPVSANDLSLDCGTVGRMQQLGNAYSYAASIRYITRMSHSPQSATATMGFRCAYDVEPKTQMKEETR